MRVEEGRPDPVGAADVRTRPSSHIRWLIMIAVTLLLLYLAVGVAWFNGGLQPWVYRVLS